MKTLTTILAIIVLASCNQRTGKKEQIANQGTSDTTMVDKGVPTGFGGNWVNKKYVDKLLETKSPKASQDIVLMTMLMLPSETDQEATIIWRFHEGTRGTVKTKNRQFGIQAADTDEFELTLTLENDLLKTGKDEFIKINNSEDHQDHDIVEQFVFAGKYDWKDRQVEFTKDGKVTGLDTITYYSVLIDYNSDFGMQVDQLRIGKSLDDSELYGFDFSADTLIIYELNCMQFEDDYCVFVEKGQEILKIIKK